MKTSSVSRATSESRSADSYARTNFATISSSGRASGRSAAAGSVLQAGARPLERAVDRLDGRAQHVGHLARAEPEDVAQDQDGELAGGQDLQGGHEGQRDGLGRLVAGLRSGRHVHRALEERVGIGLEPHDLAEPGRRGRFHPGYVPLLGRAPAGRPARVQAPVGGDPVEPGADRGAPLEAGEALPGGQQRVLQGVLGVLQGAQHPVAVHLELAAVRLGQLAERVAVPGPRPSRSTRRPSPSRHPLPVPCPRPVRTPAEARTGRPVSRLGVSAFPTARTRGPDR